MKKWKHALPKLKLNEEIVKFMETKGIFIIGDGLKQYFSGHATVRATSDTIDVIWPPYQ